MIESISHRTEITAIFGVKAKLLLILDPEAKAWGTLPPSPKKTGVGERFFGVVFLTHNPNVTYDDGSRPTNGGVKQKETDWSDCQVPTRVNARNQTQNQYWISLVPLHQGFKQTETDR